MTDNGSRKRRLVRGGDGAEILYDDRSPASIKRLARLADAGKVKAMRVGNRGDRWYSSDELEALLASVESD